MLGTYFPHWGAHAGMKLLARYLDPAVFAVEARSVSDNDDDFPIRRENVRRKLRERVGRRGMQWYKLSDLAAELRVLPGCMLGRTDVVHFLDGEHTPQYLPLVLKRLKWPRTRTVATFHQPPELLDELVSPEVVAHIDRITVVSPTQLSYFRQFVPPERLDLILHGVDTDFFRPAARSPAAQPVFRCITTGHWLRDWKAMRRVAEELRPEHGIEFHIVTNRETGLEDLPNVVAHRNIDDDSLLGLYQRADVLLLPLTQSTANNSLLEGIACGLPIVSTRLPAVQAYIPNGEGLLVDDNHSDSLVEAILRLKADAELRRALGARARLRAEELSWQNIAPRFAATYTGKRGG
jgi:glycosyltransferase involved in cell wall biosynthesis